MNNAKQPQRSFPTQHIPLDDVIVTDLYTNIPIDVERLAKMAADFAAGACWTTHPLDVVKIPIGYELIDRLASAGFVVLP